MKKIFILILGILIFFSCKEDSLIQPTKKEPIERSDTLVVLTNEEADFLSEVTPSSISFSETSENISNLQVGDIIKIMPSEKVPYGLLRKITSIQTSNLGKTNIFLFGTILATLEEAFLEGAFDFAQVNIKTSEFEKPIVNIPLGENGTLESFNEEMFHLKYSLNDFVVYDQDDNSQTTNDQFRMNAIFDLETSLDFSFNLLTSKIDLESKVIASAEINLEAEYHSAVNAETLVKKLDEFPPLIVGGVVVTPIFELFAGVKGEIDGEIKTGITNKLTLEGELHYGGQFNWKGDGSIKNEFVFKELKGPVEGTLRGYLKVKVSFVIFEILGPSVHVSPFLEADVNTERDPKWILYKGSEGGLGIKMGKILSIIPDYDWDLAEFKDELARSESNSFPSNGLVSYYNFDQDATDYNKNNDLLNTNATMVVGKINNCYEFNKTNYLGTSTNISFDRGEEEYSISIWFYPYQVTGSSSYITMDRNTNNSHFSYGLSLLTNAQLRFQSWGTVDFDMNGGLVELNEWHHAVVTMGTTQAKLYLDGVLKETKPVTISETNGSGLTVGGYYGAFGFEEANFFEGKIDELGIWNKVLTSQEIQGLYNNGNGIPY